MIMTEDGKGQDEKKVDDDDDYDDDDNDKVEEEQQQQVELLFVHNDNKEEEDNNDDDDDIETQQPQRPDPTKVIRLVTTFGKAALKYGSWGILVESTMKSLAISEFGYKREEVYFSVANKEIFACINTASDWQPPVTIITPYRSGMNLKKLGLLSDLAKEVQRSDLTLEEVCLDRLDAVDNVPNPFSSLVELICGWVAVGAALPVVLGGSAWDVLAAGVGGGVAWTVTMMFGTYAPQYNNSLALGFSAMLPAIVVTAIKTKVPQINVTVSVLSSVAIPLPGYGISLGLAELATNSVVRGFGRLIGGLVTLLWLVLGSWLGSSIIAAMTPITSTEPTPVQQPWLALAIPALGIGLNVSFQIAKQDFIPAFGFSCLAYLVVLGTSYINNDSSNLSNFLATAFTTICANLYCNYADRSQPIILIPAIVFLVSGSIGFRGLTQIFGSDDDDAETNGWSQFGQMFLVAVIIMLGLLVGNSLVKPKTTL
jgi:uncharacterized membrane protein YjjP (DUF1212 family)